MADKNNATNSNSDELLQKVHPLKRRTLRIQVPTLENRNQSGYTRADRLIDAKKNGWVLVENYEGYFGGSKGNKLTTSDIVINRDTDHFFTVNKTEKDFWKSLVN